MTWHVDPAQARGYADGTVTGARAASVEAHLLACPQCRGRLAPLAPTTRLDAVWEMVQERVDAPRRTWVERVLVRLRVPDQDARLLSAAPSLQVSWLLSLTLVLGFAAVAATMDSRGLEVFLVLAPLAPVVGVAGAYGRGIDPTYETTRATPYPGYRLLLLRVLAVLVVSVALTGGFAVLVADGWAAVTWLLPSLALVGLVLVLAELIELPLAAAAVVASYLGAVALVVASSHDVTDLLARPGQPVWMLVAAACLVVVLSPARRTALRRTP
jgi:hypothetical protein